MVSSIDSINSANSFESLFSGTTSSNSTDSFVRELEQVLQQYISQSGNSQIQINIQPGGSQNSGGSQILVTVRPSMPPASAAAAAPASTAPSSAGASSAASVTLPAAGRAQTDADSAGSDLISLLPPGVAYSGPLYTSIAEGGGSVTIPTLAAVLANENQILTNPNITADQLATQHQCEQNAVGAQDIVPGANLRWNDLTQEQQFAYNYATCYGFPSGQSVQDFLGAHVGPQAPANAPANNPTMFGIS